MEDNALQFEAIEDLLAETMQCHCGCGQVFPVFFGRLRYSDDYGLVFVAGHLVHGDSGPHVWFTLGSGPWFEGDNRNCWVTMHVYVDEDDNVVTRIEDPEASPLWPSRNQEYRYLTREEVLARDDAKEWAIGRPLDFVNHHSATRQFLRQ
jgi:hypothetical protein